MLCCGMIFLCVCVGSKRTLVLIVGFYSIYINVNKIRVQKSKNRFPKFHKFHIKRIKYCTELLKNIY